MNKKTKRLLLLTACLSILMLIPVLNVRANVENQRVFEFSAADSGTLIPSSGSGLIDTPIYFRCTGLIESTDYSVELDDVTQETGLTASTSGEIQFEIISSTAGMFTVEVVNSTSNVVASGSVKITDTVSDMMPYLILYVTIVILLGVVAKLKIS